MEFRQSAASTWKRSSAGRLPVFCPDGVRNGALHRVLENTGLRRLPVDLRGRGKASPVLVTILRCSSSPLYPLHHRGSSYHSIPFSPALPCMEATGCHPPGLPQRRAAGGKRGSSTSGKRQIGAMGSSGSLLGSAGWKIGEIVAVSLITFLCLISLRALVALLSSQKKRQPPGPRNLPFVGSLLHLLMSSQPTHVTLRDLANKYGPVMFLRMGQIDTVVISSTEAAQEVLQKKDINFASRPSLLLSKIILYNNIDIAFAPYGAYWQMLRKLCTRELLSAKMVRQLAPVRNSETLSLVRKIQEASQRNETVNLSKLLVSCSNEIVSKAAFGQACSDELQDQFMSALAVALELGGGFSFADIFPSLSFLDAISGGTRRLWKAHQQMDAIFDKIIAQGETQRGDDLLSLLLRIRDTGELEFPIETVNVKAIIADMFAAGTETTSSSAEWVMTEVMRNPEVMAKAQAEVRRVFDNKSALDHEGLLDKLPYTRMVMKESFRLNPNAPLLVPRLCRKTCDIGGFEVMEGTRVFVNLWAMSRNPEYWQDVDKFCPERFEDGTADYKASRFEYLPFGAGRRRCPGDTFGLASLELIVARLLYYFDWTLPDGMERDDIDMDATLGLGMRKKNPLHLVASPYAVIP